MTIVELKRNAARQALEEIRSGMRLGLGTGSTADEFVDLLAEKIRAGGLDGIVAVATSERTALRAARGGIPLAPLDQLPGLDLVVDGADECDSALNLIKGGGGALLREKIVAASAQRFVIIADHTKYVERLGGFALPVEIVAFSPPATLRALRRILDLLGYPPEILIRLRCQEHGNFITDGGNLIVDMHLQNIDNASRLASMLNNIPGVVDHGLFLAMADCAYIGHPENIVRKLPRPSV